MIDLKTKITSVALLGTLFLTTQAASLHALASTDYSDSRTKSVLSNPSGGLYAVGLSSIIGYNMSWSIANNGGGSYTYTYNLGNTVLGLSAAQTGFFLQLGSGTSISNLSNISINSGLINALLGTTVQAVTFNGEQGVLFTGTASLLLNSVSFTVNAAPVWGNFASGSILGALGVVENAGFGTTPTSQTTANYVVTPGSLASPEPGTWLVLGSTLGIGAILARRRKMQKV